MLSGAAATRSRFIDWTSPFAIALVVLLAALVLLPMLRLLITSLTGDSGQLSLEHYAQVFTEPAFLKPLVTTLWTSAAVGVLCVHAAAPMGWLVSRTDLPGKRLLRALILASFVTPPFLGAFAWLLLGGPNAGLINQWYYALLGLKPFEATPLINIFSAGGMVFVMALYTFPYVFTFVANSLDLIPSDLEDAAAILGAPAWRTAIDITLPLAAPALLAGFIVAFLQSMTLFGTPAILALPAGIDTMTTKIWSLFQFPPQLGLAAAASLPLLLITVALLRTQTAIMGRRGYSIVGGKGGGVRLVRLGAWKVPALALFAVVRGHRYLAFLATAPVAIPGIVLAVGLFLSYTHPPLILYGTLSIIFLAYLTKELPVGYQQIAASLKSVHPELEDAGRIFGANRLRALFDITAPLVRNGVLATSMFIFLGSIRELSATILLFTARTKTISVTMFDLRESNDWGPIAVLSITMLLITFAMIALINRFTQRRIV